MEKDNILAPTPAKIVKTENVTELEKLIQINLLDRKFARKFTHRPGQFLEVGVMGVGEAPISICTSNRRGEPVELCVRKAGRVTNAIHRLKVGDRLWIRGPYGNGFPMEKMENSNLLLIAGGLGIAPLRGVLQHILRRREKYRDITIHYGVRCYDLMLFKEEILKLFHEGDKQNIKLFLAYEQPDDLKCNELECERRDRCYKGLVTTLLNQTHTTPENTYTIICGAPLMYIYVTQELSRLNFNPERIYLTLERRMKCGVGRCGHCIVGSGNSIKFVCKDGPVFTYAEALKTPGMI